MMNIKELEEGHFFFTSESVTEGHPDKLCDSLSDAILDACLEQDPESRVACESVAKANMVLIAGEITTRAKINMEQIVRDRIKEAWLCWPPFFGPFEALKRPSKGPFKGTYNAL